MTLRQSRTRSADVAAREALNGSAAPQLPEPEREQVERRVRLVGIALSGLRAGPVLILVALMLGIASQTEIFLTVDNLGNVLAQTAVIAVLALGQLMVILTRGIDLSVGSILALSTVMGALAFERIDSGLVVILVMLGTGALVGTINGMAFVKAKLPHPFITTLAMMSIARGVSLVLTDGQPKLGMPDSIRTVGGGSIGWFPYSGFVVAGALLVTMLLLYRLTWGRWVYAVGGNPEAARRVGIPVDRVLISVYVLSGLAAGVAGLLTAGRTNGGSPTYGTLAELDAISAVIIGGVSFLGGRGKVANALVGAFMVGVLRNGLNLLNVDAFYQMIAIGAILVLAVWLDTVRERLESRFRALQATVQGATK
jgi:ribose transport system permease protein